VGRHLKTGRREQSGKHQQTKQGTSMSLYRNINARKAEGTSRTKKRSTISDKSYANMKKGFPKKKNKSMMGRA